MSHTVDLPERLVQRLERDASGRRAVAMANDHDAVPTAVRHHWADVKHHSSPYSLQVDLQYLAGVLQ